jgi:hypothetical protein
MLCYMYTMLSVSNYKSFLDWSTVIKLYKCNLFLRKKHNDVYQNSFVKFSIKSILIMYLFKCLEINIVFLIHS